MKAMVLRAPGELVLDEVAQPGLGASQVLVRMTHSGVCGTDVKIYSGAIPVSYPRIMGHEMVGEVVEAGDTHAFRPGERVIVDPELYCGACFHCGIGQTHLCPNGMLIGRDTNGGFAEYVTAPRSHVFLLPDSIDSRTAPLIQVLTTCLHAQRQVNIFPAESVVVFGLGVTGSAEKRALAEKLGADLTIPGGDGAIQHVRDATAGRGADLVIETTGVLPSLSAAVGMTRSGGRLLLFGIITAKEGALPFYDLYFKELALISARVAKSEDYPSSIALVQGGMIRLEPLVSNVMPVWQLKTAIGMTASASGGRLKIILDHSQQ
jgi:2-desacetyl-2-hydroxyethyl bacteriochlorophyllide A dehydrogenase